MYGLWQISKNTMRDFLKKIKKKLLCPFQTKQLSDVPFLFPVDDVVSSRSVGDHRDRIADLLLHKLYVFPAVLGKFLVLPDAADIAVPARQLLDHRFCFSRR
mgnify:CR=1 FL=1